MSRDRKSSLSLIADDQQLQGAKYTGSGVEIPVYDDGFGYLYIHRESLGVTGIVRAQSWEEAYNIVEDEFLSEADKSVEELQKKYGYKREHREVIKTDQLTPESERDSHLGAFEKFAELSDYTDNGKLPEGAFIRWETIETPDAEAWTENDLFCEQYGFRPNGPNVRDKRNHGIYQKDLNGDRMEALTPRLAEELRIEILSSIPDSWWDGLGEILESIDDTVAA